MHILRKKNKFHILLGIVSLFFISVFLIYLQSGSLLKNTYADMKQKIMMFDHGFSTPRNFLLGESSAKEFLLVFPKNIYKSIDQQVKGFPDRPNIEKIEITIKFKEYRKVLNDRKRSLKKHFLTDPHEVRASIKYNGQTYKSSVRLKGDYSDHWDSIYRMSLRVDLKSGSIFGLSRFSIQKNESRAFPYDQAYGNVVQNIGNLSPKHHFARIFVNGEDWGIMNIEEHMSKEILERQKQKESMIFRFGNDLDSQYSKNNTDEYFYHRIGDDRLSTTIYQSKKYLSDDHNRMLFSYISENKLNKNDASIFNVNKYSKSFILASIWGDWHTLSSMNSRNYLNPYLLKLEPITTDNGPIQNLKLLPERKKSIMNRAFYPYNLIIQDEEYANNIQENLEAVYGELKNAKDFFNYYQSFFPADKKINISMLNQNYNYILTDRVNYLSPNSHNVSKYNNISPTNDQAKFFPAHIYLRHYTNGDIQIYNLLPESVIVKSIKYKSFTMPLNLKIDGFNETSYKPNIIKTSFLGPADGKIRVTTEYKGNLRTRKNDISLIPGPYFNPISDIESLNKDFLIKTNKNEWIIKKGEWTIEKPLLVEGDLIIEPGTKLKFNSESYIIVKGNLIAIGTINENIIFDSETPWKGIYVISKKEGQSKLRFVVIKNTQALSDGLLRLTGAVNFYNSNVTIKDSKIIGTVAEDALNIINSDFTIERSEIGRTISDAFDSDFSNGVISDSLFFDVGGDAVDFSGSEVNIKKSVFNNIRDKAISAGESTNINIQDVAISDVGVGIASKDGSKTYASNVNIKDYSLYAAMTYVKKNFYGTPKFVGNKISIFPENSEPFLAQENTSMVIDNELVRTEIVDIEALYETETMKK